MPKASKGCTAVLKLRYDQTKAFAIKVLTGFCDPSIQSLGTY